MIEGLHNFRDTGGMPLTAGGTTRSGVLYRSDALATLTPAGVEALAASPIGVVVDFRTPSEREMAPDILPASRPFHVVELSILEGAMGDAAKNLMRSGGAGFSPDDIAQALAALPTVAQLYIGMLQHSATEFAEVARLVAASDDATPSAVLVHCTAGKDRTGVATALLLDAAGVERPAIIADYASSAGNLAGTWADGMVAMISRIGIPVTPTLRDLVTATPPEAMEAALAWIDAEHGGSACYLARGGLSDAELEGLRARLVG